MSESPLRKTVSEAVNSQTPLVRVNLFGKFQFAWQIPTDTQAVAWDSRTSARAVFKLLLCAPERQASKSLLAGILWPDADEEKARESLRSACKVLRKVLLTPDGEILLTQRNNGDILSLAGQSHLWVDADAFEELLAAASRASSSDAALALWERANALLHGEFLADDQGYEWTTHRLVKKRRQMLWMARCRMVRHLADAYIQRGHIHLAEEMLDRHIATFPIDQDALYRLLVLLEQRECFEQASVLYERTQRILEATGKQPAKHVTAYYERLQNAAYAQKQQHVLSHLPDKVDQSQQDSVSASQLPPTEGITLTKDQATVLLSVLREDNDGMAFDLTRRKLLEEILVGAGIILTAPLALANSEPWERLLAARTKLTSFNAAAFHHFEHLLSEGWELSNINELAAAEGIISSFLSKILAIPSYEVDAQIAYLASQGLRLQSVIIHHRLQIAEKVQMCEKSVEYARYANDANTLVPALIELADAYEFASQIEKCFKTLQGALYHSTQATPLVQSRAYSNNAVIFALTGRKKEAELYIHLAQDVFPDVPALDSAFRLADSSIFTLSYHTGLVYLNTGQISRAPDGFEIYKQHSSGRNIPERLRLEIVNGWGRAAILENDLDKYAYFLRDALSSAVTLGSKKRFDEAYTTFREHMPAAWLDNSEIQSIAEQYHLVNTKRR